MANVALIDNSEERDIAATVIKLAQEDFRDSDFTMSYLHGHANIGYGAAHNLVMHGGNTHYHLVLNPDVELAADALPEALRYFGANPDVGVLAPAVTDAKGRREYLCKRYPSVLDLALRGLRAAIPAAAVPPATRSLRDARRDATGHRQDHLAGAGDERLVHAGAAQGDRRDRRLRPGVFPLLRGLRLERAAQPRHPKRVRAHGAHRASRRRRGAQRLAPHRYFARSAVRFFNKNGWSWL